MVVASQCRRTLFVTALSSQPRCECCSEVDFLAVQEHSIGSCEPEPEVFGSIVPCGAVGKVECVQQLQKVGEVHRLLCDSHAAQTHERFRWSTRRDGAVSPRVVGGGNGSVRLPRHCSRRCRIESVAMASLIVNVVDSTPLLRIYCVPCLHSHAATSTSIGERLIWQGKSTSGRSEEVETTRAVLI